MASGGIESRGAESSAADSSAESKSQKCKSAECEIIESKSLADSGAPCPQKIGFYRSAFIGDSVVAIHALYALCKLYPRAQIVVYTNAEGAQIFSQLAEKVADFGADANSASLAESTKSLESTNPAESSNPIESQTLSESKKPAETKEVQNANFLDSDNSLDFANSNSHLDSAAPADSVARAFAREHLRDFSSRFVCVNTDEMSREGLASHIKREAFECFLLTQPNRWRCALVASSGARRIITFATARNALQPRFEKAFFSRAFSRITYREALLKLVRRIDVRHYDSQISRIDFARITFCQDAKSNAKISHFIDNIARQAMPTTTQVAPATQATTPATPNIICINPFVRSSPTNLSLESYAALATRLAERYRHIIFVFISFAGAPSLPKLVKSLPNIAIFENDKNLANLIALLRASSALISPSTGTIHIADMLQVPTIGIYSPKDMRLWFGANMRKDFMLVLKKPLQKMHADDEAKALESAFTTAIHAIDNLAIDNLAIDSIVL
ncbi:hypothetical protein BKN38_00355 [Helicobacter sp. CLO-3]|uniref:glycosyltransferase family 9 protein n=1 Tax=unclassified Helicobacter TaxID=2593540 RepID=UPI0008052F16|nr:MULTISPECIES: glycosyltransferase family 9 protein [unclassified Helicobacter]OBV30012.1 hypothetical protein BA723_03040 [Helicobacter sp. CLO-3]OHU85887.1 hypothetical protein BKN38_00355 [Helicobacter sp. CLO-3]